MGSPAVTYRQRLWQEALHRYGYITAEMARRLSIPLVELRKIASRGFMTRIDRGLYRFSDAPDSPLDPFMEAVLWAGTDAVLAADAVLALHDLAFVNPRTLRVMTPHRVRKTHPRDDITIITQELPHSDVTSYFGIPSVTVARALVDCQDLVMPQRLREAADEARLRGLLLDSEYQTIVAELAGSYE